MAICCVTEISMSFRYFVRQRFVTRGLPRSARATERWRRAAKRPLVGGLPDLNAADFYDLHSEDKVVLFFDVVEVLSERGLTS
jgi:hypothetical protein